MDFKELDDLAYRVVGAAFEVHKILGSFLYEKAYEEALQVELGLRGISSVRQFKIPVTYKGVLLQDACKVDLMVENVLPVELKSIRVMGNAEIHQILTYMGFGNYKLGLLMNFGVDPFRKAFVPEDRILDQGIYRFIR